jgi:hypothetical protein
MHASYHSTSYSSSSTSVEQRNLSASRTAAFVDDRIDSQVHRHSSADASIQEHTGRMKVTLDEFDATVAQK